ncbi:glycosyltransferase family 2 protein [Azospirillum argentinense]|nr:glycosyltransferase family A protein [Azospirillum argentinense]
MNTVIHPYTHRASIVITCRNSALYIERALKSAVDSILAHTGNGKDAPEAFRIVTVDDASTDDTPDRIAAFAAASPVEVVSIRHTDNLGASAGRNDGASHGRPQYLFFLDHDDEFLPHHVGLCLNALDRASQVGFVRTGVELTDPVHPDWHAAIGNTVVINLCVRIECHRFIGGFSRDPNLLTLRIEDVLYSSLLSEAFQHLRTDQPTVRHYRIPGNMFDRQYERFTQPPEAGIDVLTEAEEALSPLVFSRHEWALALTRHRVKLLSRCFRSDRPDQPA